MTRQNNPKTTTDYNSATPEDGRKEALNVPNVGTAAGAVRCFGSTLRVSDLVAAIVAVGRTDPEMARRLTEHYRLDTALVSRNQLQAG